MKTDIKEYERLMREQLLTDIIECERRIATGDMNPAFYAAQSRFDEARIEFALAVAGAHNEDDRRHAISASAIALGQMMSGCTHDLDDDERARFFGWLHTSFADGVREDGPEADGCVHSNVYEPRVAEQ